MNPRPRSAGPATPSATTAAPAVSADDVLARMGRWVLAKVWLGCLLSGAYALGRHFGWPQALLTTAAVLGALTLSLAAWWLPLWTARATTGVAVVDVCLRVGVWGGLAVCVVALLIGMPAVGAVAAALLINTAARTFHPRIAPLLRRYGIDVDALRRGDNPSRLRRPGPARRDPGPPTPSHSPRGATPPTAPVGRGWRRYFCGSLVRSWTGETRPRSPRDEHRAGVSRVPARCTGKLCCPRSLRAPRSSAPPRR